MSAASSLSAQQYRERAIAMRQEAERAVSYDLRQTYSDMADQWETMARKAEVEERLKH